MQSLAELATLTGAIDVVPAYCSLLVIFDPQKHSLDSLTAVLKKDLSQTVEHSQQTDEQRLIRIPVCYEGEFAPDLPELADKAGLTTAEVIARHSEKTYTVCCLGFIPGFAFLGYVDDGIATPRHAEPRAKIPAGSVGIAGRQTGIYPADSPGGWQIIGRTPMSLYAPEHGLYSRFEMGDAVQFYAIGSDEWEYYLHTENE